MLLVGLTGGIGSGKTTVAGMLAERGAVVIAADRLAREVLGPGTPTFDRVVEAFDGGILTPEGEIDRSALAKIVFADRSLRAKLEEITHPEVLRLLGERLVTYRDTDRVVVYESPLLAETGYHRACDVVVVTSAPEETRVARATAGSGLGEDDVRARMAAQTTADKRAEVADVILDNEGSIEELEGQVDRLWQDLEARARRTLEG